MQRVKLVGEIAKFGSNWETNCRDIRDIFKLIDCQTPGFRQHLIAAADAGIGYEIKRGKDYLDNEGELLLSLNSEDVIITEDDCGSTDGKIKRTIIEGSDIIESIGEQILGRVACDDIIDPSSSEIIVKAGNLMFISGQIPLDPETGDLVSQSIEDQAKQVLENVKSICEAAGCSLDDIVKISIFLTDLSNFAVVNDMMKEYFSEPYPARATVEVSGLPLGVNVEIEAIVLING